VAQTIIYCEKCGKIVPPSEIDGGKAIVLENVGVCPQCVASLSSAEREEISRRFSPEPGPAPGPGRSTTSTARKARPSQRTEGAPAAQGSGRSLAVAGVVAGVLAGAAIAVVFVTGRTGPPPGSPGEPVARGAHGGGERETPRDPDAPVKTAARGRLDEIKSMTAKLPERYTEARAALTKFLEEFGDAPEAAEAKELLAKTDAEFAAAADEALEKAATRARALAGDGKFDEARKALAGIRERFGGSGWFEERGEKAITEALAKVNAAHSEAAEALLARARKAFDSGKLDEARGALRSLAAWPEGSRSRADGLLKEIRAAGAKIEAERKAAARRREAWEAFLVGFPQAGRQGLAKARAFLVEQREALRKLGSGDEITKKLDRIERRFRAAKLVEELAEVGFRGARGTVYLSWKDAKVGGRIKKVDNGVLWLVTTRGRDVSVPIAQLAGADVVRYSRTMQQGSREKVRAASYLMLRGDLTAAREAIRDATGDAAWELGEEIDEFAKAVEAREARLAAAAKAKEEAKAAAEAKAREMAALKAGLVGHWKFDEGEGTVARDSSGKGNHGTVRGGAKWAQGRHGGALEFDGKDDKLDVPFSKALNPARFSFALWAKVTGGAGRYRSPLTSRDESPQRGYMLYAHMHNRWSFWLGPGSPHVHLNGPAVALNEWTHVACTYDGATMRMYVNGADVGRTNARLSPNTARPLRIGAGATERAGDYFFQGLIGDVRVYDKVLSADRVKALCEAGGKTETVAKPPPKKVTGLVGYWKFDEGRGAEEAKDSSGAERHGKPDGAILGLRGWRGRGVGFPASGGAMKIGAIGAEAKTLAFRVLFLKGVGTATKGSRVLRCGKGGGAWIGVGDVSTGRRSVKGEALSVNCGGMTFTNQTLRENEWHHVAFRWAGKSYEIYVNGKKTTARSSSWKGRATPAKLVRVTDLEAGSKDRPLPFDWLMDDLRVYDRALEPKEIMTLRAGRHIAK
jgi:hypothetical protein